MNGYFDGNATGPLHPAARQAWLDAAAEHWQNPSGLYADGARARQALEECREQAAELLGCEAGEIIFTSGATEGNNGVMRYARDRGWKVVTSALEHASTVAPARAWCELVEWPVEPSGVVRMEALQGFLTHAPSGIVSLLAASHETGVLQPVGPALEMARAHGWKFHTDVTQWMGRLPAHGFAEVDFLTLSGHKMGGPKGVGLLKCPHGMRLTLGGGQEEKKRAGTEDLPGIAGFLAAWRARESAARDARAISQRVAWREGFETHVIRGIPGLEAVGRGERLWNTVLLLVPRHKNVKWLARLSQAGFAVSTGAACSAGGGASEALRAMGWEEEAGTRALRVSSLWETTEDDWQALAREMVRGAGALDAGR